MKLVYLHINTGGNMQINKFDGLNCKFPLKKHLPTLSSKSTTFILLFSKFIILQIPPKNTTASLNSQITHLHDPDVSKFNYTHFHIPKLPNSLNPQIHRHNLSMEGFNWVSLNSATESLADQAARLLASNKGKPLEAIVEQVIDGSSLRVCILPESESVQVFVAGIKAPPYERKAKHFAQICVLKRQVHIVLQGVDKSSNLIASVHYSDGESEKDLAMELTQNGYAGIVDWSASMLEEEARRKLQAAELHAKKKKLRLWTNYVPPATSSNDISDNNSTGKGDGPKFSFLEVVLKHDPLTRMPEKVKRIVKPLSKKSNTDLTGRTGEEEGFAWFKRYYKDTKKFVFWLNELEELGKQFDLLVRDEDGNDVEFIEVKATTCREENDWGYWMSERECTFASIKGNAYIVSRVWLRGEIRVTNFRNPYRLTRAKCFQVVPINNQKNAFLFNKVKSVRAREIKDNSGKSSIEVEIEVFHGSSVSEAVAAIAAVKNPPLIEIYIYELRDGGSDYNGKGVSSAVAAVNAMGPSLVGELMSIEEFEKEVGAKAFMAGTNRCRYREPLSSWRDIMERPIGFSALYALGLTRDSVR